MAAEKTMFKLTQSSPHFGITEIYIVPNAFRLDSHYMNVGFLSKAPDWDVAYFSKTKKVVNHI
ncbi:MAG: hypothetical protein K8F91_13715, partial [Candidatus Obscuribacterales bacterium]|nr:hypothetical protein [Candidatus Obscuribacterales bacterium]